MSHLSADTDWSLLVRAADGELTPAEQQALANWIAVDQVTRQALLDSVKDIRARSAFQPTAADSAASLARARQRLGLDVAEPMAATHVSRGKRTQVLRWVRAGLLVACVLVGVALVSGRWAHLTARDYVTPAGAQMRITLADGTQVVLAPESHLRVPRDYGRHARRLVLEGEAYFMVVHDVAHPFAVRAGTLLAQDVGTAFDVRAYPGERESIAVTEGNVALTGAGTEQLLARGDIATLDAPTGTLGVLRGADTSPYVGWTQHRLAFTKAPLSDVVRDLSRTFDLAITVADSTLAQQRITATFDHETAEQVLEDLADIVGGSYQRNGRAVVIRRASVKVQTHRERPIRPLVTVQTQEPHE